MWRALEIAMTLSVDHGAPPTFVMTCSLHFCTPIPYSLLSSLSSLLLPSSSRLCAHVEVVCMSTSNVNTSSTFPPYRAYSLCLRLNCCADFANTAVSPSEDWLGEVAHPVAVRFRGKWAFASAILLADAKVEVV